MEKYDSAYEINETIEMLAARMDQIQLTLPIVEEDYHKLFLYYVGERFEGVAPNNLKITDYKNDKKIDFYSVSFTEILGN